MADLLLRKLFWDDSIIWSVVVLWVWQGRSLLDSGCGCVGGLVVGAWGVAAELHCAGCMIVYCIHHHWETALSVHY